MDRNEAYQILSSFLRSTYGFYNEDKSKISHLLEVSEVEEALKNIKYQMKTVQNKTFYLSVLFNNKVVIFYSSPNDFEGKRVISVFEEFNNYTIDKNDPNVKYPCTMGDGSDHVGIRLPKEFENIKPLPQSDKAVGGIR